MPPKLRVRYVRFSEAELQAWKSGTYTLVKNCSKPLKQVLRSKAKVRPGRRFFGEAFVAATEPHEEAWYGSFQWLTSPKWYGNQDLGDRYQAKFRRALARHFPDLKSFQETASISARRLHGRRPVGPDLWLRSGRVHRFIEVKLPGDQLKRHQLVGLALIGMFLRSDRRISIEVAHLYAGLKPAASKALARDFKNVCKQLGQIKLI
jgi:hypothetical protein